MSSRRSTDHPMVQVTAHRDIALSAAPAALLGLCVGAVLVTAGLRLSGWAGPAVVIAVPAALLVWILTARDERWGIVLFAMALPAGLTTVAGGLQLVQVVAVVAVVLVASGRILRNQSPLVMPRAVVALLVLVAWSMMSTLVAADLPRALRWNAALLTAALLLAAVVTAANTSLERLRHLVWALFAGSVVTCAIALPESTQRRSFGAAVVEGRAQGVFSQPNELGLFAGTTLVLALALLVGVGGSRYPRLERSVAGLGGLIALMALSLSLSRGAWLGTLLALLAGAVLVPAIRRAVFVVLVAACALAVLLMVGVGSLPGQVDVIGARLGLIADREANPYDERPAIWGEGLRQVRDKPLLGVGAAGFTDESVRSGNAVVGSVQPAHAHNVFLNFAAEGGLPVGLALGTATVLIGVGVRRSRARPGWTSRERDFLASVGAVPLVILGQGLLDAPLRNPTTLLQTAAGVGLAVAVGHVQPRRGSELLPRENDMSDQGAGPHR